MHRFAPIAAGLTVCLHPVLVAGAEYEVDPGSYKTVIDSSLKPGDQVSLKAGSYDGLTLFNIHGNASAPIVIFGPESGARAIIKGRSCCNTISLRNSSYLILRHLEVDVQGQVVDGVKAESNSTSVHHITLEHLDLHSFGSNQQVVGISSKCPAWDWVIRHNTIRGAGTGLYLGNSDGNAPFVRGIIEHNLVVDPIGYAMQIKHQNTRPTNIGMPTEDAVTRIRHNVFAKANNASKGNLARPNLLVGHFPKSGSGNADRYEIYGNLLYQNQSGSEGLFQGEGHVSFHDNVLINSFGSGAFFVKHHDNSKGVSVFHNTVYVSGTGIHVSGVDTRFTQRVFGNAVFAQQPFQVANQVELNQNVSDTFGSAGQYVAEPSIELTRADFYPNDGALGGAPIATLSSYASYQDVDRDFNGQPRLDGFRGAYGNDGRNPGWQLSLNIKDLASGNPNPGGGQDAGPADTGPSDAGQPVDPPDANVPPDSGPGGDAGANPDAATDAGSPTPDAGAQPTPHANTSTANTGNRVASDFGCRCTTQEPLRVAFWFILLPPLFWRFGRRLKRTGTRLQAVSRRQV